MRGAVRLFRVFGIDIQIHFTFAILPLLFGLSYGLKGIFLILFVFLCVTLHELVHSLQAKRFGVRVEQILLLPLGGIASMRSIPENPKQEFVISISGPMFNLIFAAILFFPLKYLIGQEALLRIPHELETWKDVLAYMFWINPILAIFNLLPAFPMDGGRVLRSVLAQHMDYNRATRIAVRFGHVFAILFAFIGLTRSNFILVIIAFFIFVAASQEGMQVDIAATLKKFYVRDILPEHFLMVNPQTPLQEVLALSMRSHQDDFPVVENGKLIGFLLRSDIIAAMQQFGTQGFVAQIMRRNFPVISPDTLLLKAHKLMEERQVKALPVVKGGSLMGIITLEDISRIYMMISRR